MKILKTLRNYFFYCGIEKDEYNALKKDAYISNFKVWRVLHVLMTAVFGILFTSGYFIDFMKTNSRYYLVLLIYSAVAACLFFILKTDSLIAQFLIYISMSALFLFACLITANKPELPATTFLVFLLITPMFMIDKPFFMVFELCAASAVFLIWMHGVKPFEIWRYDLVNVVIYTVIGIFLNVIANSIRIREFVLTRKINIQKDIDELTGIKNKSALTREINAFLSDASTDKGTMFLFDVDRFKSINDLYGHDVGDQVIAQIGGFLGERFSGGEIVGRFGGDEFILFISNTDDRDAACEVAEEIISGVSENVVLPDNNQKISISIGITVYNGAEKNYSEIFKKADTAMYRAKADPEKRYSFKD